MGNWNPFTMKKRRLPLETAQEKTAGTAQASTTSRISMGHALAQMPQAMHLEAG